MDLSVSPYLIKEEPWSSHQFIRKWLTDLEPGLTGLDIGAATGTFGQMLQGSGLIVDGVEPQEQWASLASPYYRQVYRQIVEDIPDEKLGGYDFLIMGDVLEHLVDARQTLLRLISLQPEGCLFLISVPNIANIWIRLSLLLGHFDYQDRGILDRTHLHFYTWKSFRELLASVGLEIIEWKATPIPLPQIHPFFRKTLPGRWIYRILYGATKLFPCLFGYQFVVKAARGIGK